MQLGDNTNFTSFYDTAQNFVKLAQCGDVMTGTVLYHQGHAVARIVDDRHMQITTRKDLPAATHGLAGVVGHVAKRSGMLLINKDLKEQATHI
jgi:hypothetical protein